jgi:hypothetical protein
MSDTVRDAVFGNVGTMVSFRVSADDAPNLAKQFEPQFEATDLLQMHNRHFVINMVINGEKAPAFSATTLTLPPPQIDNTGRIIENTRRMYSRSRADVEQEISSAIQTPQPRIATPRAPQRPALPLSTTPKLASQQPSANPVITTIEPSPDQVAPIAKKRRTRTRKRKSASVDGSILPEPITPNIKPPEDSTELHLR